MTMQQGLYQTLLFAAEFIGVIIVFVLCDSAISHFTRNFAIGKAIIIRTVLLYALTSIAMAVMFYFTVGK